MYDTTDYFGATKERLLRLTSEYEIFSQYLGFRPVVGQLYLSPLRKDTNPSFGLFYAKGNKTLLFKDLGTGETGDCFKLASLIDNTTIRQAVTNLYRQYVSKKITKRKTKEVIPIKEYKELDIVVDDIPFTVEGLNFWDDFGITESTLNKFDVKQINKFWVNGKEYWRASQSKPMFSYFIYSKAKIYRPFYKRMKFYSNCTITDIQGWAQLDYSKDTVFITSSLKDVMLLHELGYTAIAPNGEGHSIPKKALDILRQKFKHVVILYDRDLPGLKAAQKLWRGNKDFSFMFTPRRTEKDISDYYLKHGKDATIKHLSERLCKIQQIS